MGIKKQKTFSHRRHIARPRAYLGSEKEKRQSSLTQLDFVSSTPQEVIPISSDYEDGDFEVEQPRKKRRVSGKGSGGDDWTPGTNSTRSSEKRHSARAKKKGRLERGQQTMTQLDFVPSGQAKQLVDDIEDDDDLDYEEPPLERQGSPVPLQNPGAKRTLPWSHYSDDEMEHVPQSPATSPRRKSSHKAVHQESDLALHSIAAHDFTTPKKATRHSEIPSSQSPPSIKMSTRQSRKSQRHCLGEKSSSKSPSISPSKLKGLRRTPLIERSVNVVPPRWQPETQESQNPTMKMLQQVRLRTRMGGAPLHEEAPMPPPKSRPQRQVAGEQLQMGGPAATRTLPRKLQRTTTVQDSQASDENIMTQMPPAGLARTLTVQDSQHEDLDLSSQLYRSMSSRENLRVVDSQANNDQHEEYEEDQDEDEEIAEEDEEEEYPQTYDPVSAALERDAARYAWTQTQAPRTQHRRTQVVDSEDDSDDDDLDRGIVPDSESEDEIILLPSRSAHDGPSQELCSEDMIAPNSEAEERTPRPLAVAQKQPSPSPPSSPPPLRPSQVSTVMPTQSSPRFALPPEAVEDEEYSPPTSPPTAAKQSMIKKPQFQDTQALTISSSPLPLPPWSSSGEVDLGLYNLSKGEKIDHGGNELASLVDFSLPPPPPLGMSSSPWR